MTDTDKINAKLDEIDFVFSDTIHAELGASVIAALRIAVEYIDGPILFESNPLKPTARDLCLRNIAEALEW